jgi:hypothetical protein
MKAATFAVLVEKMEEVIEEENEDREGFVYPRLSDDMALAARAVYDACRRGSEFAVNENK